MTPFVADPTVDTDFLDGVSEFIKREVRPVEEKYANELAETGTIDPQRQLSERRSLRRRSADMGFYSAHMPEDVGGGGLNAATVAHGYRVIGRSGLLLADRGSVLPNVEGPHLAMCAMNEKQRAEYLYPLMRAEREGCFAITEPDAGSDTFNVRTRARRDGHEWVINGTKQFITHGADADFIQLVAVTDPDEAPTRRHSAFILEAGLPGFSIGVTHHTLGEDRPVDLIFDDVRIHDDAMVGERGNAISYMLAGIGRARLNIGGLAIGKAQYLLDRMIRYTDEREAFGRKIGAFQYVQQHVVDSSIEIEAALGILRTAAAMADRNGNDARRLTATAKVYSTETLSRVADRAIQVFGGIGVTHAGGIERYYRDARAMRIYEGTTELLKSNIAKWLGVPTT